MFVELMSHFIAKIVLQKSGFVVILFLAGRWYKKEKSIAAFIQETKGFFSPVIISDHIEGSEAANQRSLMTDGRRLLSNGQFEEARETLDRCLRLAIDNDDRELQAECLTCRYL